MNELALFAGAGGGILGGHLLGWRTVCAVECDPYAASVLVARQNDGVLPPFPIWDNVCTFDGTAWRGCVDVVSGGFPCQDISSAGKGAGITGAKSGLWSEMARIVGEVRPRFVFVENSPNLVGRGLAVVLGDLAALGYDARWCVLGADDVGAPHRRKRIWIAASHANSHSQSTLPVDDEASWMCGDVADADTQGRPRLRGGAPAEYPVAECGGGDVPDARGKRGCSGDASREYAEDVGELRGSAGQDYGGMGWWESEPNVGRVAHGVAARVDRLKCIGNGQVPAVAAMAWRILTEDFGFLPGVGE